MQNALPPLKPFFLDLTEQEIASLQSEFGNVLRSGQLILGKHTEAFEAEFASYVGAKHGVTYNTATSALEVLCVLKGAKGKKVAVASNTNFASVEAIIRAGGKPVFMDMTAEYFAPDLDILKHTVKKHDIGGVMWVHIGGLVTPDFDAVAEYCKRKKLFLIEDCAHAHGSRLKGTFAGKFGDGAAFSFFPTKVMTTMEGGMITTDSKEDADMAKSYRNQGKRHAAYGGLHYDHGNSWRISEIAAYMGLIQLAKLDRMTATRQGAVNIVAPRLQAAGIGYCDTSHMEKASQYKFMIRLPEYISMETAKKKLSDIGIICGGGVYEVPCHLQPVFKSIRFAKADVANTTKWCPNHICPPITSGTTPDEARRIADGLVEVLG
jgi:perosamine synthetase